LSTFNEYLKEILQQILVSYNILTELNDKSDDLKIMRNELAKINGLLIVIRNKLEKTKNDSDNFVTLLKLSSYYHETYDFSRELELLKQVYHQDPNRLKNLRLLIIDSLNDKKIIENLQLLLKKL
jgi:hypothetical protein